MPDTPPALPPYGKPLEHQPAPTPQGIAQLQNWKSQKPLVSHMKKLLNMKKLPKGKMRMKKPKHKVDNKWY